MLLLGSLCGKMGELHISGKTSLMCWRTKCGKNNSLRNLYYLIHIKNTGADPEILKRGGTLCRPPWLADEDILGFWWSEKAKIKLETISFWQNISISILKFCPFLYTMKACQWNLINFSKLANALIRKEKSWEKLDFVL